MPLIKNRYGKGRVRVMRIHRDGERHEVSQLNVKAMIEGDFARAYTDADNSTSVSTDTIKNVVNVVARQNTEAFELLRFLPVLRGQVALPLLGEVGAQLELGQRFALLVAFHGQFGGHVFWEVKNGKITTQLRDLAYQSNTPEFWKSCDLVGGKSTYQLGGAFSDGKGQPSQVSAVSHGSSTSRFNGVNVINTGRTL